MESILNHVRDSQTENNMSSIRYFFRKFSFLKVYNSPFKRPRMKLHVGKIAIGTPYFYPRRWVKGDKKGYMKPIPKNIGFDFVPLGWKTKWSATDYRFESPPIWSFVFFKWQIAIVFSAPHPDHFWECWLFYSKETDKSKNKIERLKEAKKLYPCLWYRGEEREEVCYWDYILRKNT